MPKSRDEYRENEAQEKWEDDYEAADRARDQEPKSAVLGPCGCTDYHMADCPIRTSGRDDPYEGEDAYY